MKNLAKLIATLGILLLLLAVTPAMSQNLPAPSVPSTPPDTTFNVIRQSGTCPRNIKLWTLIGKYAGNSVFTVIADTNTIASSARLVKSDKKLAEFIAPLKSNFADCVGEAISEDVDERTFYTFRFQNKNVIFRVQLQPDTPGNPSEIVYKNLVLSRPAVRWIGVE
ncbi:hypothetical protein [Argonema galeatum]|uniref:hypothetical protein n=1 Tax=Argonema galeatum TaxID=2942762 RepID=UPI002011E17A|nr:hypothetical protein [Argonema galeatum]MCL1464773.1 hypothetical protein [Argonema galeatum A003/A1]